MITGGLLARRTEIMGASAIREILKAAAQPGMISLAGGVPAPESFPLHLIPGLLASVLEKYGPAALQYDPTEGFPPFREAAARYLSANGVPATADEVIIASGSQGVLDGLGKILLNKGDLVVVESPTYLGALQAFTPYEPSFIGLESDDDGPLPDSLETAIRSQRPKFVYLNPTFQNPTGRTMTLERRREVARLIKQHDVLVVEDDPYGALRFEGRPQPTLKSLAPENVVYLGTMSKILAPGLRLGFCAAPEPIRRWLVLAKQGVDLHANTLGQALAAEYLSGGHLETHLPKIIALYRSRRDAMLTALEKYFPSGFSWSKPEGGMFLWVAGPKGFDADRLYQRALERKAAIVPGRHFFPQPGQGRETMRLNFSMAAEDRIDRAVKILADTIEEQAGAPGRSRVAVHLGPESRQAGEKGVAA
ncbi:MAG: PLP-dependent aminotransferase family protein [Pseudomonadota bacterium]